MGGAVDDQSERWLGAAQQMRRLARAANRCAAEASNPHVAARYERLAVIHLGSAACFEAAANAAAGIAYDRQTRRVGVAVARVRALLADRQAVGGSAYPATAQE